MICTKIQGVWYMGMVKKSEFEQSDPHFPIFVNKTGQAPILLVCEHASNHIPEQYKNLGLSEDVLRSHVAWDPGAHDVACRLAHLLDAPLIAGSVSRLLYDCNRPPTALDAIPEKSEIFEIPGNQMLGTADRQLRAENIYEPFRAATNNFIAGAENLKAVITLHSFTPVYNGVPRIVDVGILHDEDSRLATALCDAGQQASELNVQLNEPYSPKDGVTHTLVELGIKNGLLNVMIEMKNSLVSKPSEIDEMSDRLAQWIKTALGELGVSLSGGDDHAPLC